MASQVRKRIPPQEVERSKAEITQLGSKEHLQRALLIFAGMNVAALGIHILSILAR